MKKLSSKTLLHSKGYFVCINLLYLSGGAAATIRYAVV